MNLIRKGHGHTHRGIIGIESAIVLIAFVIVAAALAFVVLNTGFSTTQKAKTTIISSLGEASSGLEIAGKIMGLADTSTAIPRVNATSIPLKVASGGDSINLDPARTQVSYLSNSVQYDDIFVGADQLDTRDSLRTAIFEANANGIITADCWAGAGNTPQTEAFIYWSEANETPPNVILDLGEHAIIALCFGTVGTDERPAPLDVIRVEIIGATGATLTAQRQIPPGMTNAIVDLG